MNDLPSRMKNPPTEANLVVPFTIQDWDRLQAFKKGRSSSPAAVAGDPPPATGASGEATD